MISVHDAYSIISNKTGIRYFKGIFLMSYDEEKELYYVFSENGFSNDMFNDMNLVNVKTGEYIRINYEKFKSFHILSELNLEDNFKNKNDIVYKIFYDKNAIKCLKKLKENKELYKEYKSLMKKVKEKPDDVKGLHLDVTDSEKTYGYNGYCRIASFGPKLRNQVYYIVNSNSLTEGFIHVVDIKLI